MHAADETDLATNQDEDPQPSLAAKEFQLGQSFPETDMLSFVTESFNQRNN